MSVKGDSWHMFEATKILPMFYIEFLSTLFGSRKYLNVNKDIPL